MPRVLKDLIPLRKIHVCVVIENKDLRGGGGEKRSYDYEGEVFAMFDNLKFRVWGRNWFCMKFLVTWFSWQERE